MLAFYFLNYPSLGVLRGLCGKISFSTHSTRGARSSPRRPGMAALQLAYNVRQICRFAVEPFGFARGKLDKISSKSAKFSCVHLEPAYLGCSAISGSSSLLDVLLWLPVEPTSRS
jgi:hypothetical protein